MLQLNNEFEYPKNIDEIKEAFKLNLSIDNGEELDKYQDYMGII